ncbi:MAG: sporulation initiation factor Spo0A C-terminal domain-containing protein [Clostridia bacterium]|nr:sporulation initiation factor Spo0A C-terminal domain-containing protein [Clostridia bacterium]
MLITSNYKGYHYLLLAYELTRKNHELLNAITTRLYPEIAKHFNTTTQAVERSIRTIITLCQSEGLFMGCKYPPTSAQFIGMLWALGPSRFLLVSDDYAS